MKSIALGALTDDDTRIKVSNGLTVLELLLSPNQNETFPSSNGNASLTWKALSTRLSALQTAVSVLVDLDDELRLGANVRGSVGQRYEESSAAGEEECDYGGDAIEDLSSVVEAASVISLSNRTLHDTSAIHVDESPQRTSLCFTRPDAKPSPVGYPGVYFPATAPLESVQPVEFSIRLLSHQLSEFSNTLLVECNRTKIELAAECKRSHKLELERDVAVMKKNELEKQIQDAERARAELVQENLDLLAQIQKSCLETASVASEKVALQTQLEEAVSQKSALIKEKDDLLIRLAQTTSTMNLTVVKKDKLSKRLDEVISINEALVIDNKVFVDRIEKAYLQRDTAQKMVDELMNQIQDLIKREETVTTEKEGIIDQLWTANTQINVARKAYDSVLKQKASLETTLYKLKDDASLLKLEIHKAQSVQFKVWGFLLKESVDSKRSIPRTEGSYINKVLKSIETYSHHFSVTYQCLQESEVFATVRLISTLPFTGPLLCDDYNLKERAKAILKRWQIVWDEGQS